MREFKIKLSFWTKYILAWVFVFVIYSFIQLPAIILSILLTLEYFYQRFVIINPRGE